MPLESSELVVEESIQGDTDLCVQPNRDEPEGDVSLSQRDSEDSSADDDLATSTSHALERYTGLELSSYSRSISGESLPDLPPPTTARVPAQYLVNQSQLRSGRVLQSGIPSEPGASQQAHPATNLAHEPGVGPELNVNQLTSQNETQHLRGRESIIGLTSPNQLPPIEATTQILFESNHRYGDSQLRPASDQSVLPQELPQRQGANPDQQAMLRTNAGHGKHSKSNSTMDGSAGSKYTQVIKSPLKRLKRKLNSNSDQSSSSERPKFSSATQAIGNLWRRNQEQGAAVILEEREGEMQGDDSGLSLNAVVLAVEN